MGSLVSPLVLLSVHRFVGCFVCSLVDPLVVRLVVLFVVWSFGDNKCGECPDYSPHSAIYVHAAAHYDSFL